MLPLPTGTLITPGVPAGLARQATSSFRAFAGYQISHAENPAANQIFSTGNEFAIFWLFDDRRVAPIEDLCEKIGGLKPGLLEILKNLKSILNLNSFAKHEAVNDAKKHRFWPIVETAGVWAGRLFNPGGFFGN